MASTNTAYYLDGTPYCVACVESDSPCLSPEEKARTVVEPGLGRCGCCNDLFEVCEDEADEADEETSLVGLDITTDANVPRAVCVDCMAGYEGESIRRGEEWGGYKCRCQRCGTNIDVTLVY